MERQIPYTEMESSLPFPDSKRVIFNKNPLAEVICQLRFPPVLEIVSKDPADFQNDIRGEYPLYVREEAAGLPKEVADLLGRLPIPRAVDEVTHKFSTEDGGRTISLTREFVAVTEKAYRHWEGFRHEVDQAKVALEKWYKPAFYSRLGLRYRDVIRRSDMGIEDEPWESLVKPAVIGLLGEPGIRDKIRNANCVTLVDLSDHIPGGVARIQNGLASQDGEEVYVVDVDFFTEERSPSDGVVGVLDGFNRLAGNLFRWAITPKLHAALDPSDVD